MSALAFPLRGRVSGVVTGFPNRPHRYNGDNEPTAPPNDGGFFVCLDWLFWCLPPLPMYVCNGGRPVRPAHTGRT